MMTLLIITVLSFLFLFFFLFFFFFFFLHHQSLKLDILIISMVNIEGFILCTSLCTNLYILDDYTRALMLQYNKYTIIILIIVLIIVYQNKEIPSIKFDD